MRLFRKNEILYKGSLPKCKRCPYYLGTVKCIRHPCPQCIKSGSKENPFDAVPKVMKRDCDNK